MHPVPILQDGGWIVMRESGLAPVTTIRRTFMDYGKSGKGKAAKGAPRYDGHKDAPQGKDARGGAPSKAELLARMKAAREADARKDG